MQSFSEGLIYLLVLAVAYLANYLFKRFGPKMEPEPPQAEVDERPMTQEPVGPAAASIAGATRLLGPQAGVAKAMLPTRPRGQLPRRLMGSKRSKQTAVAMAAILGPCKAFEPDADPASPGR